jgi:uncharacterized protein YjiS (DUF1127 family)
MLAITPPGQTLRLPRFVHLLVRAMVFAATRVRRLAVAWRRRQEATMLARADDRILADLGLSRGDVNDAFSGPPWEDPTTVLRSRALERRLSRHGVRTGLLPPSATTLPSGRPWGV